MDRCWWGRRQSSECVCSSGCGSSPHGGIRTRPTTYALTRVSVPKSESTRASRTRIAVVVDTTVWTPSSFRTASGTVLPTRRAFGVRFRYLPMSSETFRTDFAISPGASADYGLLAWRDLALDFDARTVQRPRAYPDGTLALSGILRLTLRPDRFPVRVG